MWSSYDPYYMPERTYTYSNDSYSNYGRFIPRINAGENVSQAERPVWSLQNAQNGNASNESPWAFDLDDEHWQKYIRCFETAVSNEDPLSDMSDDRIQYGHPEHTQPHLFGQQSEQQGVVQQDVNALASFVSRESGETTKFNQVSVSTETEASNTTPQAPTETKKRRGRPLKEEERFNNCLMVVVMVIHPSMMLMK
uniref:Uncharacterized protein n=1 Tax=Acrobeloides nanus TaxID=290746 RepID=A0A914DMM2_9BILA